MRRYLYQWLRSGSPILLVAAPIILSVIGPFGTYDEMSFGPRLLYWSLLVVGVGLCMLLSIAFVMTRSGDGLLGPVYNILIGAGIGAFPGCVVVISLHDLMRDSEFVWSNLRLVQLWFEVFTVGLVISLAERARIERFSKREAEAPVPRNAPIDLTGSLVPPPAVQERRAASPRTRMHERLPDHDPGDVIVSITMQDHYVAITTDRATHMILMRFIDALQELEGLDGLRIHRSHWVARDHMHKLERKGHRMWLILSDGRRLPVSQTYLDDVRNALGLEPVG